ncbi:beta-lactamase [Aureimonas ureilytica]|uniref:Beta-lactamase n=1 Tax=Aureimonas ureilytica TaxID=401562 RepID=A0A175RSB9_9HYPH|nr:MBL fold metallo-hydrolase [Aureimonas ureilytica]KTR06596.1 beta-lactamase [Aureimonas ureilytica]
MSLDLDTNFQPEHGRPVEVAPEIVRLTAPNASPMTFTGTNTYLLGRDRLVVIDPGPSDERHLEALLRVIDGRPVESILVTHTHLDHSGLCDALKARTSAPVVAEGPHRTARPLAANEINRLDAAADHAFRPDRTLRDGETMTTTAGRITGTATPGHTANHMAFALEESGILFSGDHVMSWSTSIVAPPDGGMADYMASLDKLLLRSDTLYLPGHGGPIAKPLAFVRALRTHRRMREQAILERVRAGDRTIPEIVKAIYRSTPVALHGAAALSVFAHLENLCERGLVATEGDCDLSGRFEPC